jgi:hypothetical protein
MRRRNRISQNTMAEELYAVIVLASGLVLSALLWTADSVGSAIDHTTVKSNPIAALVALARGKTIWPPAATYVLSSELAAIVVVAAIVAAMVAHHRSTSELVDRLAKRLPRNAKALRRYVDPAHAPIRGSGPGLALGVDVVGGKVVRQSWEDVAAMIAGARTGKTTTFPPTTSRRIAKPGPGPAIGARRGSV